MTISGYISRYDFGSIANVAKNCLPSPYLPPNQFAHVTDSTPDTACRRLAYAIGSVNTIPVALVDTSRRALPKLAAAAIVVTTVCSDAKRKSAIATLAMGVAGTVIGCGVVSYFWQGHIVSPISPLGFCVATAGAFVLLFFYKLLGGYYFVEGTGPLVPRRHIFSRGRRNATVVYEDSQ